jgi:hypothetical protein
MAEADDEDIPRHPVFPNGVRIAAIIWLMLGISMFINMVLSYIQLGMQFQGLACCTPFLTAIYLAFGVSVAAGLARKTFLKGLTSIGIGLLSLIFCIAFFGSLVLEDKNLSDIALILGTYFFILGVSSIIAGVLAIRGEKDYQAWCLHPKSTTPGDHS